VLAVLGLPPREHPACNEAGDFLLADLPGSGVANDYYWYYATIAMYQLQGAYWQRWNEALQSTLLSRQVKDGPLAGSWNTDTLWAVTAAASIPPPSPRCPGSLLPLSALYGESAFALK